MKSAQMLPFRGSAVENPTTLPASSQTNMPGLEMNQRTCSMVTRVGSVSLFSRTLFRISVMRGMSSSVALRIKPCLPPAIDAGRYHVGGLFAQLLSAQHALGGDASATGARKPHE